MKHALIALAILMATAAHARNNDPWEGDTVIDLDRGQVYKTYPGTTLKDPSEDTYSIRENHRGEVEIQKNYDFAPVPDFTEPKIRIKPKESDW